MSSMSTTDILKTAGLLADLLARSKRAYDAHRAAAVAAGVPESAMQTADAILARDDADPLADEPQPKPAPAPQPEPEPAPAPAPTTPTTPSQSPYDRWLDEDPGDEPLQNGDYVYDRESDGKVWVNKGGRIRIGFPGSPSRIKRIVSK